MKKLLFKCSNEYCSFQEILKADTTAVKIGDTCFICNEGTILGEELYKEIDATQFPTLAKYHPKQIWDAVDRLQERDPTTTEHMALVNLEMDLHQQELMS